jgi:hypothetical protein
MAVQLQHVDEHHMRYTLKQLRASYRSDTVTVTLPTVGRPCSRHEVKPRTTLCTFSTKNLAAGDWHPCHYGLNQWHCKHMSRHLRAICFGLQA